MDEEKINKIISGFSDEEVFNFGFDMSQNTYLPSDLKNNLKRVETLDDYYNIISISDNLVSDLQIKDVQGRLLDDLNLEKNEVYYLIPRWMQEHQEEIEQSLCIENDSNIIYIENDQIYKHLVWPNVFMYDCIIEVYPPDKSLFSSYADNVLLSKEAAQLFNEEIKEIGLSEYIVKAISSDMDNDLCISNLKLELLESIFYLVIMLMSYCVTSISIILIYFEFKKKYFSVYALFGKRPIGILWRFLVLMGVIVGICAFVTEISLILIVCLEWLYYISMSHWYMKKKAVNILKGA